jgi:hypothetical protein
MRRGAASPRRGRLAAMAVIGVLAAAIVGSIATTAQGAAGDVYNFAGYVGVIQGQTMRLDVTNIAGADCVATLQLIDMAGNIVQQMTIDASSQHDASMDFVPSTDVRNEVRPVIMVTSGCTKFFPSLVIIDNTTGRTGVRVGFIDPIG